MPDMYQKRVAEAIRRYWSTRMEQANRQESSGRSDQGARSAVTGGAQMDGFVDLITNLIVEAGVTPDCVYSRRNLELPGFFRPTKEWDILVVSQGRLAMALELKSQVGPSFGNNFNNRTEEAMGSALDIWTAFREGAFNSAVAPWIGYLFLLEGCDQSRSSVRVKEPHFKVFSEFVDASYLKRYELFCRKLVLERHYSSSAFIVSERQGGLQGQFSEPASDLSFEVFARSMVAQARSFTGA
jgi:hypothetical protein